MKFYYPSKPTRISIDSDLFEECDRDPFFILQTKKNGWRIQIHKDHNHIELYSRHNKRLERIVPDANWELLSRDIQNNVKATSCILDGEFLHRRGNKKNTIYLWDIFELNSKTLRRIYSERKHLLNRMVSPTENLLILKDHQSGCFKKVWDNLSNPEENEGIVLKDIREELFVSYRKTTKALSPRQFKILLD